jgi:cyclase
MIKKRIIPKILLHESRRSNQIIAGTTINYNEFRSVGDPESQAGIYQSTISDELMVVVSRQSRIQFQTILNTLEKICAKALMPISFGGSISNMNQVNQIFGIGVEKIIFGRSIHSFPKIVNQTADRFGSQAVVASMDYLGKPTNTTSDNDFLIFRELADLGREIQLIEELGVGEICLSDVHADGRMGGSNLRILEQCRGATNLPIIQNCGIGRTSHFVDAFKSGADAVAVGSYFAFHDQNFIEIRSHIKNSGIDVRL